MNDNFNNMFYGAVMLAFLFAYSLSYSDDNEIYVDQAGASASIDIEQLGSGNLVGGLNSSAGNMTPIRFRWSIDVIRFESNWRQQPL